jgi:hypothetical protein
MAEPPLYYHRNIRPHQQNMSELRNRRIWKITLLTFSDPTELPDNILELCIRIFLIFCACQIRLRYISLYFIELC